MTSTSWRQEYCPGRPGYPELVHAAINPKRATIAALLPFASIPIAALFAVSTHRHASSCYEVCFEMRNGALEESWQRYYDCLSFVRCFPKEYCTRQSNDPS